MLPEEFEIAGRPVGRGHPTYIVAEAGANHNRELAIAFKLIEVAAEAGADAVKFQTYSGHRIYSKKTPPFRYLASVSEKTPSELLEELSLPRDWQPKLLRHAHEVGIEFFSTPFDDDAVKELDELDVPVLKIASFEIVDVLLIRSAASTGRPLLISTGMATLGEIEDALSVAVQAGAPAVGLLQCTSLYPAPPELANLRAMDTMRHAFRTPTGLSDHTTGVAVPIAAAALGASFIEKHFTLDRRMKGPDHAFALEPAELKQMVDGVRQAQSALGSGRKDGPSGQERAEMYDLARRSLIATRPLHAGTVLTRDMLTTKRPGFGIAPKHLDLVIGRRLRLDVEEDDVLTWERLD
jgi:N,N'-diacetyllegionaminate synthase